MARAILLRLTEIRDAIIGIEGAVGAGWITLAMVSVQTLPL
jgi:hypothetical protein